jgi:hypothetical protein
MKTFSPLRTRGTQRKEPFTIEPKTSYRQGKNRITTTDRTKNVQVTTKGTKDKRILWRKSFLKKIESERRSFLTAPSKPSGGPQQMDADKRRKNLSTTDKSR